MSEDTIEVVSSPADTIIMSMEVDRQSSHTVEATNDGLSDPEWERRDPPSPMLHTTWTSNTTAMAKCDTCERGSRGTLQQCRRCAVTICQECFDAGKLSHDHQLDADSVDWNQHNKSSRSSKKRASRARPRFDSSSATASAGTSASPHSQERQFGGVVPPDTASPSNSVPSTPERPSIGEMFNRTPRYEVGGTATVRNHYGNNGYAPIEPHPSSDIEQAESGNYWNSTFSQPPGRHREYLDGSSSSNGATLASSEDPSSWNHTFGQRRQDHQGSSAYRLSASATFEGTSPWNMMFGQPQTRRQHDQMQTSQNSAASANNGEWRQSFQSSSAYNINQLAYPGQQEPAANLLMRSRQDLSSSWQPHDAPYPSAARSNMYYSDLFNYGPVPIAVAPAAFPRSPSRVQSTPRVLPERIMPRFLSLDLRCHPSGPPRRYEDYFDLH
ncbi:uncharacterized protein NECHADRAFT_74456 [Fusarium vanettenii 77-13-4]|uniref:Uncharacterized protein n=1 Tax=Fusarium vanettenii (strain ATCC MYA-4622 / CBS 123669 / FGSC 9596 / NRRL 45880 / 77-13-4) TaxID=660122 RepID=C7YK21_FUSV7|nr:uncharacterized protein NECHADRAFT_74456 [Fusarium vanettenii 77-13-4]EEU47665.1 predicted protein [Fusarium vanettenii 77-13-4]